MANAKKFDVSATGMSKQSVQRMINTGQVKPVFEGTTEKVDLNDVRNATLHGSNPKPAV